MLAFCLSEAFISWSMSESGMEAPSTCLLTYRAMPTDLSRVMPAMMGTLKWATFFDKGLKKAHIVDRVGEEEIDSHTNLLFHVHDLQIEDMTFGGCIDLGAHTKLGFSLKIVAHEVVTLLEALGCTEQAHHIEIKDGLGFEVISNGWRVPLEE